MDGVEKLDRAKTGANALALRARTPRSRSRTASLQRQAGLTCDASALEGCKGTLALLTAKRSRSAASASGRLASAKYDLKAGTTRGVTVKLPSVAKRLASKRSLKVDVQAISKDATGAVTTRTAKVTLKFPR